ncbi:MAG TPA: DUF1491 family protein [Hellea balneolensis]|uniref:DUF1491 family protein n=1 Tax=Hellea balneolensis TaxID=287478 RepID=A0A7C5LRY6_9PROT|nr:DUF1491 family protein [Hellea balneolensis]
MYELKTSMWSYALLRRASIGGALAVLARKGDGDAGACLVIVNTLDGLATLYRPIRNEKGERIWLPKGPMPANEIDHLIAKRVQIDPDLWVIEIEDKHGRHFLTEPVEIE